MTKVAICFMTKDRVELSQQTILPLLGQQDKFDLHWCDGSSTEEGCKLPQFYDPPTADPQQLKRVWHNVTGGPDAAVAFAVTSCLAEGDDYDYIGIVENDVLLPGNWFDDTMALFERGRDDGLEVGAVSARCYEDRILFQRDGYAVCHNLGFGMVIWSHKAAETMLANMRTSWTTENRRVFMDLSGIDIGTYWAFRTGEHWLCADWGVDRVLAAHGLASLALSPSNVEMIGQVPSLAEQGLKIASSAYAIVTPEADAAFKRFVDTTRAIREHLRYPDQRVLYQQNGGGWLLFAHQLGLLQNYQASGWRLKWTQGFGPHSFRADENAELTISVTGPCAFMVGGGEKGATIKIRDHESGFEMTPMLQADPPGQQQVTSLVVPGSIASRQIALQAEPGAIFYGISVEQEQAYDKNFVFDHTKLPPV